MVENGAFYSTIIDPLLKGMRKRVTREIKFGEKVIDIACGTGAQVFDIAGIATAVTGVDLSEPMIQFAQKVCDKQKITNTEFVVCNAADLSVFQNKSFDLAIMTLALHQFDPNIHSVILDEMKRVARRMIFVDYAVPLPKNFAGTGSRVAEFFAGKEHNRNFKKYYQLGGLNAILPLNNLSIQKSLMFGKEAFQLVVGSEKW